MRARLLGLDLPNWLFGSIHVVLLGVVLQAGSPWVSAAAVGAISALSLFAWVGNYRRYRLIKDVPASRVANAAQGYVELSGRGVPVEQPLHSPYRHVACVWCRWRQERKGKDGDWSVVEEGETTTPFYLVNITGRCFIDPQLAEIHVERKQTWKQDGRRYSETLLRPDEPLYALGEFKTLSGEADSSVEADVGSLLAAWKADKAALLARFDANRDGEIDLQEWAVARQAAQDEVDARRAQTRASTTAVNVLGAPADGRLFLLTNEAPAQLARTFARWSIAHIVIFIGAAVAALGLLGMH